jgi:hypothetical protein
MGTTPAEPTTVTTVAHIHFGPRTWLAGRRLRSMSAASLRIPSAAAVMASSLRVRPLRSLHCLLAAMPTSACTADPDGRTIHRLASLTVAILPSCRVHPRRNRTGDPILTIDARVVHEAVQHLTYPRNRTGERRWRGSGRGAA